MALVRARIGIEDRDATVDVTVGDEHLVSLRIVGRLGGRGEVLRIVAPVALSGMANLEEEFAILVELQDLRVAFSIAADPEVALRVDGQPVLVCRPLVAGARPSPSLEEPAVLIELHHEGRRNAAIGGAAVSARRSSRRARGSVGGSEPRRGRSSGRRTRHRSIRRSSSPRTWPGRIDLERRDTARRLLGAGRACDRGHAERDDGQERRQAANLRVHCFSKTRTLVTCCPCARVKRSVNVLPSLDIVRVLDEITLPSCFWTISTVYGSMGV